ncbi:hypothetical protein ABKN59_005395 [Abortiporus biennis]
MLPRTTSTNFKGNVQEDEYPIKAISNAEVCICADPRPSPDGNALMLASNSVLEMLHSREQSNDFRYCSGRKFHCSFHDELPKNHESAVARKSRYLYILDLWIDMHL